MMNIVGKPNGKHILVVDSDTTSLAKLRSKLIALQKDWNVTFATTGVEALTFMANTTTDVVLADFHLPQMDGIEFLNTVKNVHPETTRFILSSALDRGTILKMAGPVHPFLSKPLDMEELQTAIGRALTLRDAIDHQKIAAILAEAKPMPTIPVLYDKISRTLRLEFSSMADIAELISEDMGMSAKILQLVNAAFFGLSSRVENVAQAISLLGVNTIKGLVLTTGVFEKFSPAEMKLFDVQTLYLHSIEVGGLAHAISTELHEDNNFQDLSALAGMMHDFGKIILMRSDQNIYREVYRKSREEHRSIHEVEQELLGVTHAEVGAYILRQWGLSEIVVEAIAFHHTPLRGHEQQPNILTAVHIANALSHRTVVEGHEVLAKLDYTYIESLNLQSKLKSISDRFSGVNKDKRAL